MFKKLLISSVILVVGISVYSSCSVQNELAEIIKRAKPSIVVILTYDKDGNAHSLGSGFFINKRGDVITNRHVIQGAARAEIKTTDGKVFPVKQVVGEDKGIDLVRISVDILDRKPRPVRLSSSLPEEGERIIVIGSPLGLEQSTSEGIVSAIREIQGYGKVVQITAPISPGSSGSPVLNYRGEVIGIATSSQQVGQNLNFAIPTDRLEKLVMGPGLQLAQWGIARAKELVDNAREYVDTDSAKQREISRQLDREEVYRRWEKAVQFCLEALKADPYSFEAYLTLGKTNFYLGRYAEGLEAYQQAISLDSNNVDAYRGFLLNYNAVNVKKYGTKWNWHHNLLFPVIEAYEQIIRINPEDGDAHYSLSLLYSIMDRDEESFEAIKKAVQLVPNDRSYCSLLANEYGSRGRYSEAIKTMRQFLFTISKIEPAGYLSKEENIIHAHYMIGRLYKKSGDLISAYKEYEILKGLSPKEAEDFYKRHLK